MASCGPGGYAAAAHPVFVSYEEKREQSDRKAVRKSSGHTYTVKFFLVDLHGREHLAATGEDQGDAHYLYENQSSFPFLRANNKADVRAWLDGIVARSKERAGVQSHLVTDEVPPDPSQIHLPKFVGHSHEKRELPDGRHRIEWFLLDEHNDSHLAIVGEEKETRDGHYQYRTQGVFDKHLPLQVGNQKEVDRWIDAMVCHGGVAPPVASGKAPGDAAHAPAGSGRGHSSELGAQRAGSVRAGSHARPSGAKAGVKHDLLRQATSNVKKLKAGGRPDPDQEAREAVAAELSRWAQEEAQRREAAKKQALAYATDPLAGKEAAAARRCLAVLQQAAAAPAFLPPPPGGRSNSSPAAHQQQLNLVDTLAALRELAHMYAPLSLVALPELKECLGQLQAHKHPEVAQLAGGVLRQWLRGAVAQALVLTDPRYVEDPRSVLENSLSASAALDPIVAAVTHRQLAPPPHAGVPPRAGSRLGMAGEDSAAAATPGGLSSRPSEQSLHGMAGAAGGGAAAAADSAGVPYQTVERRRLVLDAADSPAAGVLSAAGMRRQQQLTASGSGEGEGSQLAARSEAAATEDDDSRSDVLAAPSHGGSLRYVPSVDLINAPIQDLEGEQAEVLR